MTQEKAPAKVHSETYESMGLSHEDAIKVVINLIKNNAELCDFVSNVKHNEVMFLQTGKDPKAYIINKEDFLVEFEGVHLETATRILTHNEDFLSIYHMEGRFEPLIFNVNRATFNPKFKG